MTELLPGFADDDAALRARIGLVALRLSLEVNRMRAIRGDGREERFAGVLMRDEDVAALCRELVAAPLPDTTDLEAALRAAEARYAARLAASPAPPAIERLRALYGLSGAEESLFAIALGAALDPRIARVLGYLNEDMAQQHLTLALAQRLLGGEAMAALWSALQDGPLVRHGLVETPLPLGATGPLKVPAAIQRAVLTGPDAGQVQRQIPATGTFEGRAAPQLICAQNDMDALVALPARGPLWMSNASRDSIGDMQALSLIAALNGQQHLVMGCDGLEHGERKALARSLGRHATLITKRPALWHGLGQVWTQLEQPSATAEQRHSFWAQRTNTDTAALLAEEWQGAPVLLWALLGEAADAATLETMLRAQRSEPMHGLADRVPARFTMADLELPKQVVTALAGFAARRAGDARVLEDWGLGAALGARRGAIALFLGPSGVGKTMAASVVAQEAGLDLWRINLASVVSKYIGETEANLDRVFRAADRADVVLFFDEAEALFSKRADVKDARDRYANMEMAYLLQRIEEFRGMAILASNMGSSLEPAMLRRFDLVQEFTLPDAAARRRLWGRIETGLVPLAADVDLDQLAEVFELAGGHIRQAILTAAHEAVASGEVGQTHLVRAVAREYSKLGKPLRKEDFGAHFAQVRGLA